VFDLSNNGTNVSVTYGFVRNIESLIKKFKPTSIIACWDGGVPAFRCTSVPSYKTGREHGDPEEYEDFLRQINELNSVFRYMGILSVRKLGCEADDLCYQASRILEGNNLVVSGDKDLLQCVDDNTSVFVPNKDTIVNIDNFEEYTGITLKNYVDWRAIQGDSSDNIPGVVGVGPVTATKLFKEFETFTGIYNAAIDHNPEGSISGKVGLAITSFGFERLVQNIKTMNLAFDRVGARKAIADALNEFQPASKPAIKKWLMANSFVSLMELPAELMKLQAPKLSDNAVRQPVVCNKRWAA
jgi:5'-3' exonuclease